MRAAQPGRTGRRCARGRRPRRAHLDRLPVAESWTTDAPPREVLDAARQALRRRRYRVDVGADGSVAAEKGYLRETGNLLFHSALLLLLVAVAVGQPVRLPGHRSSSSRATASPTRVSAYDTVRQGSAFDRGSLAAVHGRPRRPRRALPADGVQRGAPRDFRADVRYTSDPEAEPRRDDLRVNHPLVIDGTKVFLLGNGYAPEFTVRDGTGEVVFSGPVPFLPRDANNTSIGVVKVPGAQPEQLGFEGLFLPTAVHRPGARPDLGLPRRAQPARGAHAGSATSAWTAARRSRSTGSTRPA